MDGPSIIDLNPLRKFPPKVPLFVVWIILGILLEDHARWGIADEIKTPTQISLIDTFHEWVRKLNDAMYEEPRLYTEIHSDRISVVGALEYPGCNQTKADLIAKLWSMYYTCLEYQFLSMGPTRIMFPDAVAVLEDGILHLTCMICVSPRVAHNKADWFMKKKLGGPMTKILEDEFTTITSDHVLSIYKVSRKDSGIYWCVSGSAKSQDVYVHILPESDPTETVRPSTARIGPYETKDEPMEETLSLTTRWTEWNQCTTCGIVGRRTRWGACFVRSSVPLTAETATDAGVILSLFVYGLPCRSLLLPKFIREKPEVLGRANEIMMGLCKVPCVDEIFEVRNDEGKIVLMVNNSAGLFSTLQVPPKLPPMVVRQIKWPLVGQPFTVTCPGSMAVDTPTEWKINMQKRLVALFVNSTSKGRVSIDMRDRIVFKEVSGSRYQHTAGKIGRQVGWRVNLPGFSSIQQCF
ncbi:hypothetical protein GE061_015532 [Apolygus lucorum]|uniref:Ig-like domain-containing protein n=1 Tax=Apolygus lucorum TaxID=248454 RepID=A0A8S9XL75_APOLU|nr:hypothetical protein GE061_015532 [Apolygus lucorum]